MTVAYINRIVEDWLNEDCLIILSRGLSSHSTILNFLERLYSILRVSQIPKSLSEPNILSLESEKEKLPLFTEDSISEPQLLLNSSSTSASILTESSSSPLSSSYRSSSSLNIEISRPPKTSCSEDEKLFFQNELSSSHLKSDFFSSSTKVSSLKPISSNSESFYPSTSWFQADSAGSSSILSSMSLARPPLILLINTPSEEIALLQKRSKLDGFKYCHINSLNSSLNSFQNDNFFKKMNQNASNLNSITDRTFLYALGGIWAISSRVLVVDLLTGKLPANMIDGIIVNHAHQLEKNYNDVFIIRLYRQSNRRGFLKAITDRADVCTLGMNKLEKLMKLLLLKNVHLYPRYHTDVQSTLKEEYQPNTHEIVCKMPNLMMDIQTALFSLLNEGMHQINKHQHILHTQNITLQNLLYTNTHKLYQDIADHLTSTTHKRLKKIINDIPKFRKLLTFLVKMDAIQFLSYLDYLRMTESVDEAWLFTTEAEILFKRAQERVFKVTYPSYHQASAKGKLEVCVENNLKWDWLIKLVYKPFDDINILNKTNNNIKGKKDILIVCEDD